MEHNLSLSVAFATKAQRDFCRLLLSDNIDRPLFEEDVPEERRLWFRAIDEVDVPDSVKGSGPLRLHLTWLVGGYSWEDDLLANMARFAAIGGHGCYALAISEMGHTTLLLWQEGALKACRELQGQPLHRLLRGQRNKLKALDQLLADGGG